MKLSYPSPLLADMALPKLSSCCCSCSLKTGTIMIGALSLAASVLLALLAIVMLASANTIMDILDEAELDWSEGVDRDYVLMG